MGKYTSILWGIIAFLQVNYVFAANETIKLAEDEKAKAVILVAPNAPKPIMFAASELAQFLKQVTGASFEQVEELDPSRINLAVGPGAARMIEPSFSADELGNEGTVIRVIDGKHLLLAGGKPRGSLYAVYTFLEDQIGCRWWTSKASTIPNQPSLSIPASLNTLYVPPLEYRYPFWSIAFDANWLARNKANGHWKNREHDATEEELLKRYGGYMSHGGVHTFYQLIPPEQYFQEHPEWFSEIDGKRRWKHAQLCLSNQEMRAELIKNLKRHMTRRPIPPIYSVSQNDWFGYCTCDRCKALADKYSGQSGVMLHFVNDVAAAVEGDFPDRTISTLAYQYTRQPPKEIRPRSNVVIQLCSIECSFAVPLTDERNAKFRDDIIGWSKIADRLYIWDYTGNFRHYFVPHPNLRVLGSNVRFFEEHHAKGIFEQGAYNSLGAEFAELRSWVLAKLLWDPSQDAQALIREFCEGYYGSAGTHILKYIELIHDAAAAQEEYAHCLPSYDYNFPFLNFQVLNEAWQHLERAGEAVADSQEHSSRVQLAQLWVLYSFMWKWDELQAEAAAVDADWPIDSDIRNVAAHFKEIATKHGVTRLQEWEVGFGLVDRCVKRATEP